MSVLYVEYKGYPAVLQHHYELIEKIRFIKIYQKGLNSIKKKEFNRLEEALDFDTLSDNEAVFISFIGKIGDVSFLNYKTVRFEDDRLFFSEHINFRRKDISLFVDFNDDKIHLWIYGSETKKVNCSISYARCDLSFVDKKSPLEEIVYGYDYIPEYNDLLEEISFLLKVAIKKCDTIENTMEFNAYLLQEKHKGEKASIQEYDEEKSIEINNDNIVNGKLFIENLIGLEKVKLELLELKALAQYRKQRLEHDLPVTPSSLHMVFTGNPGTGKTTVARLLGEIYHEIGLLEENKVIEVTRNDLVGQYVGHTAPKTQKVFESALGGILFIDEAYSLFKTGNDFGGEAVETLLKLMEDNREKIVIIIAGYPKEIEELLKSNPGLDSRFPRKLHFEDYSRDELAQIFFKMCKEFQNTMTENAKKKIIDLIDKNYNTKYFNSNARSVRNLFEDVIKKQSFRLSKLPKVTKEDMQTFTEKDIPDLE